MSATADLDSMDSRLPLVETRPDEQPPASPAAVISSLSKRFRRGRDREVVAIDSTSLTVEAGEVVVLLGSSGCGKTTLLRCLAGLERPDSGDIYVNGRHVYSSSQKVWVAPQHRGISMIFQSYALWPHMTAFGNVAYPLTNVRKGRGSKQAVRARVERILEMVGISELENQYPHQMSGGQQQRVALARALVSESKLILFDEPLSNVDAKVREQLRVEMIAMQRTLGFSAVYVTHDQSEAVHLADRIAVIEAGRVLEIGTPKRIYDRPQSRFVANFLGAANELDCSVETVLPTSIVTRWSGGLFHSTHETPDVNVGADVTMFWRPENGTISLHPQSTTNEWRAVIEETKFAGASWETTVRINDVVLRHTSMGTPAYEAGAEVWYTVNPDDCWILSR